MDHFCTHRPWAACALVFVLPVLAVSACGPGATGGASGAGTSSAEPTVSAASDVDAGRYLVQVAGCNDCHTEGYIETEGAVPESEWLKGCPSRTLAACIATSPLSA